MSEQEMPKKVTLEAKEAQELAMLACEFGYRSCEKGWNLQKTLFECATVLVRADEDKEEG